MSLMAAGVAALAVGTMVALSNGWLRGTNVATNPTPSPSASSTAAASEAPSPVPSPTPVSIPAGSPGPLGGVPILVQDPESVDVMITEDPGDPENLDPALSQSYGLDGVRMDAREAGVKIVCVGPDGRFDFGTVGDPTSVASDPVVCDGTVQSFRYDLVAHQPMITQVMSFNAAPQTAFRLLVESYGYTDDPVPTALPGFATPDGTVVADVAMTEGAATSAAPVAMKAGTVPPRNTYHVAIACLGQGTARWSIGAIGERDFIAADDVDCDGAAIGFVVDEGVPQEASQVWVTTDPANTWHIVVTDPYGDPSGAAPSWIAPHLVMWAGTDMEGAGVAGLSRCTSHGEGGDSCAGPWSARDGSAEVDVPVGSDVTVRIEDGWQIGQARITANLRDAVRADPFGGIEVDVAYFADASDPLTISLAGLEPGEWMVRISFNATKGSDTFGGHYDIPVNVAG
jgi:hypothetical protein